MLLWVSPKECDGKMIAINLLNWREKQVKIKNNIFYIMVSLVVFSCFLVVMSIDMVVRVNLHSVKKNIDYLNKEDNQIEQKISEVKGLQQQKEMLLSRRSIVDSLQDGRTMTVKILDNLSKVTPNGIVFNQLTKKGDSLVIDALGDTNAAISNLMKNVERLKWVKDAKLSEIKTMDQASGKDKSKNNLGAEANGKVSFKLDIALVSSNSTGPTPPAITAPGAAVGPPGGKAKK